MRLNSDNNPNHSDRFQSSKSSSQHQLSFETTSVVKAFMLLAVLFSMSACQMSRKKFRKLKAKTVIENPYEIKTVESEAGNTSEEKKDDFHASGPTVVKSADSDKEDSQMTDKKIDPKKAEEPATSKKADAPATKPAQPNTSLKNAAAVAAKTAAMDKEIAELQSLYPFKVGERIEFTIRYSAFEAGHFTFEVKPVKQIEGRPVLHFYISARTSSVFAWVYTLKDYAESFWDMKLRRPYLMKIYGEESRYIREVQTSFDWKKKQARYQAKILEIGKELDEEDKSWTLEHAEAQDIVSAIYYLRTKDLAVGKTFDLRVAEKGKDILVRAKVEKEVVLNTKIGKLKTFVVKPTFSVDGSWKQKGEMTLWITNDKYKTPIQFEAKIKLGTIRGKLFSLKQ